MLVDETYYTDVFGGKKTDAFDSLNRDAQAVISYLTRKSEYELSQHVFLTDVLNAICSQIQYMDSLGGEKAATAAHVASESYAGAYSYTVDSKQAAQRQYVNGVPLSGMVFTYLANTGLLYAGVSCA